jgi:putative FmdB family regulatory protein
MPLYEYHCTDAECEQITTDFRSVAGRHDSPDCEACGKETRLEISAPATPVMNPHRPVKKPHNL